jgi:hypothetical protein
MEVVNVSLEEFDIGKLVVVNEEYVYNNVGIPYIICIINDVRLKHSSNGKVFMVIEMNKDTELLISKLLKLKINVVSTTLCASIEISKFYVRIYDNGVEIRLDEFSDIVGESCIVKCEVTFFLRKVYEPLFMSRISVIEKKDHNECREVIPLSDIENIKGSFSIEEEKIEREYSVNGCNVSQGACFELKNVKLTVYGIDDVKEECVMININGEPAIIHFVERYVEKCKEFINEIVYKEQNEKKIAKKVKAYITNRWNNFTLYFDDCNTFQINGKNTRKEMFREFIYAGKVMRGDLRITLPLFIVRSTKFLLFGKINEILCCKYCCLINIIDEQVVL